MRSKQRLVVGILGLLSILMAVAAWAQGREKPAGASSEGAYKVTHWPDHAANSSYAEEVEQHLNRMAAEGWRFHSEMVGQSVKMMVFERAGR